MFVPIYPVTRDTNGVKSTSTVGAGYEGWRATNPLFSVQGTSGSATWLASSTTNQKLNVDLGRAEACSRIRIENWHHFGAITDRGIRNFTVYGTNEATAFNNTTYADTNDLTELGVYEAREHSADSLSEPEYFYFENETAYRYYILRIADNWGHGLQLGVRRVEFQKDISTGHAPIYLLRNDGAHVKATTTRPGDEAANVVNRVKYTIGGIQTEGWQSNVGSASEQKINFDLSEPKIIKKLYLENYHSTGNPDDRGIRNFTVYGTNEATAFNNTTYADTNDLTELGVFEASAHIAADNNDPQIFDLTNDTAYRYYILRIADNYGDASRMGCRRIYLLDEHTPHYPPIVDPTTITATTNSATAYQGARRFSETTIEWESTAATNQKFIVDYGDGNAFAATRLMLENSHNATFAKGINSFAIYGSNSAPSTDYATDAGLVQLASGLNAVASTTTNEHETQYFDFSNTTEYRYYVLKVASNLGDGSTMNIAQAEFHGAGGAGPTPGADSDAIFFGCNF